MQMTAPQKHIMPLLFLIPFLMGTGVDLYVPSLPTIQHYFLVPTHLTQLTIGLYMLGYGVGQVLLGIFSDSFGRKKILVISGILFTLVSFLSVTSPNIYFLIVCRFIQGFAIAGPGAICRAIASDCFSGLALTKAMTYISTSWALGPIIGPVIGGYLQHYFNWQADFYFFGLYGLLIFSYATITFSETNVNLKPFSVKQIISTLKMMLSNYNFMMASLIASVVYAILVVFNIIAPFLIQIDLKYSVIAYGHIALLLGFGYFAGNFSNRFLVSHIKPLRITSFAIFGALFACLMLILCGIIFTPNLYILLIPTIFLFFCCGLIFPNMMSQGVSLFTRVAGTASALFGSLVSIGVFLMTIVATKLNTHSQMPMAIMYFIMLLVCLILFIISRRIVKN